MKLLASFVILVCVGFLGGEVRALDDVNQNDGSYVRAETARLERQGNPPVLTSPPSSSAGQSPLSSKGFMFNASTISPASKTYTAGNREWGGGQGNVKTLLERIANLLLIVVSTGAVLSIIIWGFLMATSAGDTEKANRGKIIITYNIMAVCIAMLSFGIIQFVIWVIGVPS